MAFAPRVLVHNWRLKLTALGLSVLLWALVQTEPRSAETVPEVPLMVEVTDTAWTPTAPPVPASVELRLSGPAREIIRLARRGTIIRVPVSRVGSPDTIVVLRRDWVVLGEGSGLSVESFFPATVRILFEPAVNRPVPVAVRTEGVLPTNLALASPIGITPTMVRVRGAESRVDGLDSIRIRPLVLSGVTASGVFELPLDTTALGGLHVVPNVATVGIRVEEKIERVFTNVPVIALADGGETTVQVDPAVVTVTLRGARTLVASVDPGDLRAWVAPEQLRNLPFEEARQVPVRVEGVPDLVAVDVADDMVSVIRVVDPDPASGQPGA